MTELATALGPFGVWGHLDTLAASDLRRYVSAVAGFGYGALWVPETVGREPFALLGAIASEAGSMWLGTSIASIWARDAMATRMGAMTLHELTGGRFVLGLGVSHQHLAQKLRGHVYDRPLGRMREYLADYRRLPFTGPTLPGEGGVPAEGGEPGEGGVPTEPPVVLAALRSGMLRLAATTASGAFPYLVTAAQVTWIRDVLDTSAEEGPRPLLAVTLPVVLDPNPGTARAAARGYLAPYLRTPNYQASWEMQGLTADDWTQPGSDTIVDGLVAWGPVDVIVDRMAAMRAAGADHVAVIPISADGSTERLATLEALAGRW